MVGGLICGIKIPLQELEPKMWGGGGAYVRGGAYLRDTTVIFLVLDGQKEQQWVVYI